MCVRLASVADDTNMPPLVGLGPLGQWALGGITILALSDAIRAFRLATEAPYRPGVRTLNAVSPKAWVAAPVVEILRNWWGSDVDISHFEQPGNEFDSAYMVSRIEEELGFVAKILPDHHAPTAN